MARAFFDDPIYTWTFPDQASRLDRMMRMNAAMLRPMLRVPFIELYTTPDHAGLAMWAGPEKWDPPARAMFTAGPRIAFAMGLYALRRFLSLMDALKKAHPKQPHWYLMGIGTDPPRQGTGVGTALIAPMLDRCDRQGLGSYLETQKADNVPYYERFGYRVTSEIDPPLGAPHMWLMWRDPT